MNPCAKEVGVGTEVVEEWNKMCFVFEREGTQGRETEHIVMEVEVAEEVVGRFVCGKTY